MKKLKMVIVVLCLIFSTTVYANNYSQQLSRFERQFSLTDQDLISITGDEKDQLMCLSLNVYFEARGTIITQQSGVAWVVKNRARSDRYQTHNLCDVVFERYYGVPQFSWTSTQHNVSKIEVSSWRQAQNIAKGVYYDKISDPTSGARSFHELRIGTGGSRGIRIGTHIFYDLAAK